MTDSKTLPDFSGPEASDETLQLVMDSFRGEHKRVTIFAFMKIAGCFLLMSVAFLAFFYVTSVQAQIAWATAFIVGSGGGMQWWLFYWLQVNRNTEVREIKRLEVQLAELTARLQA